MYVHIDKSKIKYRTHYYFMYNGRDVRMGFDCIEWTLEAAKQRFFNLAGHLPGLMLAEIDGKHFTPIYPEEKMQSKYMRHKEREAYFARQRN